MAYIRKTTDVWYLMGNEGYGWECYCTYDNRAEAKEDLKAYQDNTNGLFRLEKYRERIEKEG